MNKGKRFFIFFSSAGIMFLFLYFSLSVRPDQPLKKWAQWFPENKVRSMMLDNFTATGQVVSKPILYSETASVSIKKNALTELEVNYSLKEADVKFFHDKTQARKKPKTYYIELEINSINYYAVVEVEQSHTYITEFGKLM